MILPPGETDLSALPGAGWARWRTELSGCLTGRPAVRPVISPFKTTLHNSVCFPEVNALIQNPTSSIGFVRRIGITPSFKME